MTHDACESRAAPAPIVEPVDAWQRVARGVDRAMDRIARDWAEGRIDSEAFYRRMGAALRLGHINSHMAGQRMAGVVPVGSVASDVGAMIADLESQYLQGFAGDLRDGRLTPEDLLRVRHRQRLYLGKMRGTAGMGFVDGSTGVDVFIWELRAEENCADCPIWAAGGPYTKSTLAMTPGDGGSACLGNCKCVLIRERDGAYGPLAL